MNLYAALAQRLSRLIVQLRGDEDSVAAGRLQSRCGVSFVRAIVGTSCHFAVREIVSGSAGTVSSDVLLALELPLASGKVSALVGLIN